MFRKRVIVLILAISTLSFFFLLVLLLLQIFQILKSINGSFIRAMMV